MMGFSFSKKTVKDTPAKAEESAVDLYASEFKHELVKLIVENKRRELPPQNYELLQDSISRDARVVVNEQFNGYWRNSYVIEEAFKTMRDTEKGRDAIAASDYVTPQVLAAFYHESMRKKLKNRRADDAGS